MDIDQSVNGWFERISLIQKKADHYKLCQDILSSLSDQNGLDFYIKSKGIVIGANTCILRCRCPRFYYEVIKKIEVGNLPIHLLELIADFIKCVYSEDDVTALENKLIRSINLDHSKTIKKLPSIDLYESKRILCDINPLYYSLAHYDDFSSSEFSDFDQCTFYGDTESGIVNQTIIDNYSFGNMDMNLNNSVESHIFKSQSNSASKEANVLTNGDNFLEEKCLVNCNIDVSDPGNKVQIVNNLSCDLQHAADDINSFLNVELEIKCNNTLDLSTNIQKNKINHSTVGNVTNNTNNFKSTFSSSVDSSINNSVNEKTISFNNDVPNKIIQETEDDLDVVSPHNFETFTVIQKNNHSEDIFCKYKNIEDGPSKIDQDPLKSDPDPLKSESINFQTFTVINENIIIDDKDNDDDNRSQKDKIVNSETFEPENSSDYKTFTVVNGINKSPFHKEQLSDSSNSILPNNDTYINNNDILDLDILPSTHTQLQFDTITLSPQSSSIKNELKQLNGLSRTLTNDEQICNSYTVNIVQQNSEHNKINFKSVENAKKEVIICSDNFGSSITSVNDSDLCTDIEQCSSVQFNQFCTVGHKDTTLNFISEENSPTNNILNHQHLENLKSSGESDSTLSLHLDILENTKGINSPDSLNEDEVFGQDDKPVVSNKLEFVPLEATPIKDYRSPRLSRKYMECSPVISANAYIPDMEKSEEKPFPIEESSDRKNSSSFFIDFNEGKPKNKPKRFDNLTKSLDSSTITNSKEKIFSMFIDFNEDSESSESSSKGTKYRKPQTLADRFVRMHSEEASVKPNDREDTVTPPPSRMTSTVENSSVDISESCKKQSVFMFIENDSPSPVKRRSLPQSSRLKSQRNSWNVDSTVVQKTHHRTHSVNLAEESHMDARMTQSHIETGSKEFIKPSFDSVKCNTTVTLNGKKDSGIGLVDSFVRLSDMDKAPSQEMISSLNKIESKSESMRRDLKNTELGRCLKRMFPYLKTTEIERILLSKPPKSLDNKEDIKIGLGQDLLRMFLEEIGADTTIDINGRRIKAHKCVLTSRCQYFAAMFSGGWVQSAGNVLYLKGFSYKTVHLTLRYIYSGECNFSEIKNVSELSKLADMLCLEGLKDNIMLYLAAEYCHFFKEVCERCTVGILECLTLSVSYGLDDLYLSCIVWINDNFSVVWPTNHFVSLPQDLKVKCFKHKVAHIDDLNDVLSVTEGCEKIKKTLPNDEWAKEIIDLTTDLSNNVIKYLAKHFYSTITSKYFKQMLENENLFIDSFATHLLASCNCANRNQLRQAYDNLNKSSSNHFWHTRGEILVNAIMELIVKGLTSDFRNGRERQAMGSLPNDYRMSETLTKRIAFELGVPGLELAANGTLITSSPVKKISTSTRTISKTTPEKKTKPKTIVENTPINKIKTNGKFSEVKSRYMEPKPQPTTPTPQKALSVHKELPRGRRMSSSSSLTSSPSVRSTMSSSRLSTNRVDTGLKTKTSSELSLSTPKTKPRTIIPKTDPLPLNARTLSVPSRNTPKITRKPLQSNNVVNKKMPNEKIMNGAKKPHTITPKTKSLPNGHPTIGSRSGTFCKDEPTVIHSKDITS